MKRRSKPPGWRVMPEEEVSADELLRIRDAARYEGAPFHKLHPGDYGFVPPSSPRPSKSVCDDLRPVLKAEAKRLFREGIRRGMVSRFQPGELPKYIGAVDSNGEVYEAKTKPGQEVTYHGYRLGEDAMEMRDHILSEWSKRSPKI